MVSVADDCQSGASGYIYCRQVNEDADLKKMPTRKPKPKAKDVVARSVTIVDEHGEGQIFLSADSKMGAQIHFLNCDGPGIHIDVIGGNPSIVLWSKNKKVRTSLGCDDITAGLMIHDSEGKPASISGIDPNGDIKQGVYRKSVPAKRKRKSI